MNIESIQLKIFKNIILIALILFFVPFSSYGQSDKLEMTDLFLKVNKSVVSIITLGRDALTTKSKYSEIKKGIGSGIVISKEGLIMTASHVVHIADRVIVRFSNGQTFDAEVLSSLPYADLALLKLKKIPEQMSYAQLGDSSKVQTGERIFVVGAPYGIDHTLTVGYVSGRHNDNSMVRNMVAAETIQIDAAVNPGNSGGPVFNTNGQVIGIVSHILSKSGGFEGLGFSIAINTAKKLLLEQDPFWSGVEYYMVSDKIAEALNIPQKAGLLIQRVAYGSAADKSGLKPGELVAYIDKKKIILGGDIILEINGMAITKEMGKATHDFQKYQELLKMDKLNFKIFRKGKVIQIEMVK
jgi:serine protease Do